MDHAYPGLMDRLTLLAVPVRSPLQGQGRTAEAAGPLT